MPTRMQLIFDIATVPVDLAAARVHVGSFTESVWVSGTFDAVTLARLRALASVRAAILPASASITGYRATDVQIVNGRVIPGATQTGSFNYVGRPGIGNDIPQMALSIKIRSNGVSNVSKFSLHAMADDFIRGGEFVGGPVLTPVITQYLGLLCNGYSFVGRDRSLPKFRINSITANQINVDGAPTWQVGDTIRLLRVRDVNNRTVRGAFRITVAGLNTFTLAGLPANLVVGAVGQARKEAAVMFQNNSFQIGRATTRKIGRPSESYRGRAARR